MHSCSHSTGTLSRSASSGVASGRCRVAVPLGSCRCSANATSVATYWLRSKTSPCALNRAVTSSGSLVSGSELPYHLTVRRKFDRPSLLLTNSGPPVMTPK